MQKDVRTILILGGGSGIGKAISLRLLGDGYNLIVHHHSNLSEDFKKYKTEKGGLVTIQADLTNIAACDEIANQVLKATQKLHAIIYCSGLHEKKPYTAVSPEEFTNIFNVNIAAPLFITQKLLPLLSAPTSSVVCIGSMYAHIGANNEGMLYAASKAALLGFIRTLARTNSVRANIIEPGYIDAPLLHRYRTEEEIKRKTETVPLKRLGSSEEVAAAVSFLVSENATYITGQTIHINGGVFFG